MRITGEAVVRADPARVRTALADPAVLARTLPRCRSVHSTGDGRYALSGNAAVASVAGAYEGAATVSGSEPDGFAVHLTVGGAPGTVDATVRLRLSADGEATRVACEVDASVGGRLGGVGRRLLESAANQFLTDFLTALDTELTGPSTSPQLSVPDVAIATSRTDKTVIGVTVAAAVFGFAVGWWIGRRVR